MIFKQSTGVLVRTERVHDFTVLLWILLEFELSVHWIPQHWFLHLILITKIQTISHFTRFWKTVSHLNFNSTFHRISLEWKANATIVSIKNYNAEIHLHAAKNMNLGLFCGIWESAEILICEKCPIL